MTSSDSENSTRQRLLDAAGECFAQHGFHGAPVREISQRADANVAAINYHFGDKYKLYESVLLEAINYAEDRFSALRQQADTLDVAQRLHGFISSLLIGGLDPARPEWHCKLLCMEMADPGPALETLFTKSLSGRFGMLRQIVSELLDPPADDTEITLHACSVLGQTLFYLRSRQMLPKMLPGFKLDMNGLETLTAHIARFSLAAIEERNRRISRPDG
ncbi:MAG: CerR family C-terminal domain-containing protein [Phycisphaerales bacterium]|jgi:TetR/AcrR family transcriptional regulator, regulator of cefoperazone and chloramphenicol sensitivity|nr:CerR family C-terminal domain-containing protein [Phycisphaerales bacterium]